MSQGILILSLSQRPREPRFVAMACRLADQLLLDLGRGQGVPALV